MPVAQYDGIEGLRLIAQAGLEFTSNGEIDYFLRMFPVRMEEARKKHSDPDEAFFAAVADGYEHPLMRDYHGQLSYGYMMECRARSMENRKSRLMAELKSDNPFANVPPRHDERGLRNKIIDRDIPGY